MDIITIDIETYWDQNHSLTKMSPTMYVMHKLTEIQSAAIKVNNGPTEVLFGIDDIRARLKEIDWSNAMALGHNMSGFDSMILAWRIGVRPKMYGCTAAMARSRYSKTAATVGGKYLTGVSLKKLSAEFGVGAKLDLEATNTKGKRLKDFTPDEIESMREYNKMDTELCYELFKKLYPQTPKQEMVLIDMTTRMLVYPKFHVDRGLVVKALDGVKEAKRKAMLELTDVLDMTELVAEALNTGNDLADIVKSQLSSSAKFKTLLEKIGVEVPMKPSPTNPEKTVPALAKTDEGFIALCEHSNPLVAAAAQARLDVKSTLLETRLQKFLDASDACKGRLPAPLKYCGADTTGRWSGEQYNMQNLPRIGGTPKPSDALRNSLRAPEGHKIIVADLSGIELRVNMFLWKVPYAMKLFQESPDKADLYKYFAAHDLYNIPEDEVSKQQRQVGKVAHLGLGFGAGGSTFQKVAKLMGGVEMELDEATGVVNTYRSAHSEIVDGWRRFQMCLPKIHQGIDDFIDPWDMCRINHQSILLPSGRSIHYPNLRREKNADGKDEWMYGNGRTKAKIYAGKGVENIVQALARDVIAEHAIEFQRASGLRPSLMVHDELVYIVPEADAQGALDELQNIMRQGVSWWPELVTWSEGDIADTYGDAK